MPKVTFRRLGDEDYLVPPGIRVPAMVEVTSSGVLADEPATGGSAIRKRLLEPSAKLEMVVEFDPGLERYRVAKLTVDAGDGEVNGTLLRRIRVNEYTRLGLVRLLESFNGEWAYSPHAVTAEDLELARRRGPSKEMLWAVAFAYRWADLCEDNPAAAVAEAFDLQPRTATNWIRRARELGMFETMAVKG